MENGWLLFFPGGDKSLNSYDTSAQGTQILEWGVGGRCKDPFENLMKTGISPRKKNV